MRPEKASSSDVLKHPYILKLRNKKLYTYNFKKQLFTSILLRYSANFRKIHRKHP